MEVDAVINFGVSLRVMSMGSPGLSPIHKKVGAEACGRILGEVISMDQHSNTAFPVGLVHCRQYP